MALSTRPSASRRQRSFSPCRTQSPKSKAQSLMGGGGTRPPPSWGDGGQAPPLPRLWRDALTPDFNAKQVRLARSFRVERRCLFNPASQKTFYTRQSTSFAFRLDKIEFVAYSFGSSIPSRTDTCRLETLCRFTINLAPFGVDHFRPRKAEASQQEVYGEGST